MAKKKKKATRDPRKYVLVHKDYLKRIRVRIAALDREWMEEDTPEPGPYVLLDAVLEILKD